MQGEEGESVDPQDFGLKENPFEDNGLRSAKVKSRAGELEGLIQTKLEMSVEEGIAGDSEKAASTHKLLFGTAVAEPDPEIRKLTHQAHLLLEIEKNKTDRVKSTHGDRLSKSGEPMAEVFPAHFYADQMISEGTVLAKGMQGEKLRISNEDLADTFVQFGEYYLQMRKAVEGRELPEGSSPEMAAAVMAAQRATVEYFGLPTEHSPARNGSKYVENIPQLNDFKGDQSAVCSEYDALAHQLLSFAGLRTRMISGGPMIVGNENWEFDNPDFEGHVFSLLLNGPEDIMLYDPANPIIKPHPSGDGTMQLKPYLKQLDKEQQKDFYKGNNVGLEVDGTHRLYAAL